MVKLTPRSDQDGRSRRAARSHHAIVDAVFDLVAAHGAMPTTREVARRAGVGERTVFRHFADLEGLFLGVEQRLAEQLGAIALAHPDDERDPIGSLLRRRSHIYEAMAPFRRAARRFIEGSEAVRSSIVHADTVLRLAWRASLGHIIAPADHPAVDLLLSIETWEQLRSSQGLSVDAARATLDRLLQGLCCRPPVR